MLHLFLILYIVLYIHKPIFTSYVFTLLHPVCQENFENDNVTLELSITRIGWNADCLKKRLKAEIQRQRGILIYYTITTTNTPCLGVIIKGIMVKVKDWTVRSICKMNLYVERSTGFGLQIPIYSSNQNIAAICILLLT